MVTVVGIVPGDAPVSVLVTCLPCRQHFDGRVHGIPTAIMPRLLGTKVTTPMVTLYTMSVSTSVAGFMRAGRENGKRIACSSARYETFVPVTKDFCKRAFYC